ncbi:DUF2326 domain-containing protein [Clostridium sp. CAG:265]|uniref:DUF2326 domain-containing protein n=1 Tax=Clostridium sp. CAG:265 TaxID=1262787 RepID=UPI00033F5BC4|nr:DUF2326 domain-containing protein [Clostridium sp. CAG:265]CDB74157.1 putative uncharacterized protein [Clostridium sp. CAG:265]
MLKQIQSSVFRKGPIFFHEGLNTVLGDDQGSNSIGKSTLLMIVDFIFGGSSYIEKNKDTVRNLGHHFFEFILEFNSKQYYFRRSTKEFKVVEVCNENFTNIDSWSREDYKKFLHKMYMKENDSVKFRSCVGVFSRIAQKDNFFNSKPLKSVINSKEIDGVNLLIKLFNMYKVIEDIEKDIKKLDKKISIINSANRYKYIKKPTAKQYEANKKFIETNSTKLNEVALNLSIGFNDFLDVNYQEAQNELYEAKKQKEMIISKLKRVNRNIESNLQIKKKSFEPLQEYFEGVNIKKLQEIEEFHKGINNILLEEFYKAKKSLDQKLIEVEQQVQMIEEKILDTDAIKDIPNKLLEPLVELINKLNEKKKENNVYEEYISDKQDKDRKEADLVSTKKDIIYNIEVKINNKMKELNKYIYGEENKYPIFKIKEKEYFLTLPDNTGTARGYANLIIFDISILKLTILPFIIHDSVMFKNIGNLPMAKIIEIYNNEKKQCFIAIDEINKFTNECQSILYAKKVISLSDKDTLFIKDWTKE